MVIGLFGDVVPKTVENFKRLAEGLPNGIGYKGTKILQVIRGFMIKGEKQPTLHDHDCTFCTLDGVLCLAWYD